MDEHANSDGQPKPTTRYPTPEMPVIFSDVVPSMTHAEGIVKFYFGRFDPSIAADGTSSITVFSQVVMPIGSFAAMVSFFESQLELMMRTGAISREKVEAFRNQNMSATDAK